MMRLAALPHRALLYAHDASGLGHTRRTLTIATALAKHRPDVAIVVLTSVPVVDTTGLPSNVDIVRIPPFAKRNLYHDVPDRGTGRGITAVRAALIREAIVSFAPDLVLVDDEPGGVGGEARSGLLELHAAAPETRFVLGLKEIIDEPVRLLARWRRNQSHALVDDLYDRILIYGSLSVGDPLIDLDLSATARARAVVCGYVTSPPIADAPDSFRARKGIGAEPLILVTPGGGDAGAPLIRAFVSASRGSNHGATALVVTGPLLDGRLSREIADQAGQVGHLRLVSSLPDITDAIAAADLVVTMGGYNTLCETLVRGKRIIAVPQSGKVLEQRLRVERMAALGLLRMISPEELTPDRLATAIGEELRATSSPPPLLDFGGLPRVVAELSSLLPSATEPSGH